MRQRKVHTVAANKYYTGFIQGKLVVVTRSGVGKVNAAIITYVLINQFDVSSIIFTGIAGAASPKLNVADVVISTALVQHDVDLTAFGAPKGQLDGYDDRYFYADKKLQALAINAAIGESRVHSGIIADNVDGSAHLVYEDAKQVTAENSVAITLNMIGKM